MPILCSCLSLKSLAPLTPIQAPPTTGSRYLRHRRRKRYLVPGDPKSSSHHHQSNFPRRPTWRTTDITNIFLSSSLSLTPSILFFAKHPTFRSRFTIPFFVLGPSIHTDTATLFGCSNDDGPRTPKYSQPLQLAVRNLSFFFCFWSSQYEYRNTQFSSSRATPAVLSSRN